MRKMVLPVPPRQHTVPMSELAELMDEWASRNLMYCMQQPAADDYSECGSNAGVEVWKQQKPWDVLSQLSGVPVRKLFDIRRGYTVNNNERQNTEVAFDTADKLTTAMHMNYEWIFGRLAPYYHSMVIAPDERSREMPEGFEHGEEGYRNGCRCGECKRNRNHVPMELAA